MLTDGPAFTLAYSHDGCCPRELFSYRALFTTLCHDEMPFVGRAMLTALADGDPAYLKAFQEYELSLVTRSHSTQRAPTASSTRESSRSMPSGSSSAATLMGEPLPLDTGPARRV